MRILLVEDDDMIGEAMREVLQGQRFTVDWVKDGRSAELALANDVYALLLLDLGLPRRDGLTVLKEMRKRDPAVPVIIVTARDAVSSRIEGLNAGANDYVIKPFHPDELVARIRAQLRSRHSGGTPQLSAGPLTLDPVTHDVQLHGAPVEVSAREFALLHALLRTAGAVLSREQLEEQLYGWGEEIGSNAVEVHIHNLRKKLGPGIIRNIRGVGYKVGGAA